MNLPSLEKLIMNSFSVARFGESPEEIQDLFINSIGVNMLGYYRFVKKNNPKEAKEKAQKVLSAWGKECSGLDLFQPEAMEVLMVLAHQEAGEFFESI